MKSSALPRRTGSDKYDLLGPATIRKDLTTSRARLERIVAGQEVEIRRAFDLFITSATDPKVLDEIADLLDDGDIHGALQVVDRYVARLANVLPGVFTSAAGDAAHEIARLLGSTAGGIGLVFDPTDPEAAAAIRASRLEFITGFSEQQRAATRTALEDAFMRGAGRLEAARAFRQSIGLTEYQVGLVNSFRQLLIDGSARALTRQLRDRRFDPTVRRAVQGQPLTPEQIERMVEAYQRRSLIRRSEAIARTESTRAVGEARQAGVLQSILEAGIDPIRVRKIWNRVEDERVRPAHDAMHRQEVRLDQTFTDGDGFKLRFPGDPLAPAKTVVNCRCVCTFRVVSMEEALRLAA